MGGMKMPKYMVGGKMKKFKKGGGMSGLSGPQKEVYRRGLAAYMSSGNRPKVSQHAWAMARVKSAFGRKEAAKIRAGKGKKKTKK
jgi:predicted phage gp36 major capsid-like protein